LLVDFRGHGNSGGQTTTIGQYESEEVKLAWDHIKLKGEQKIFLYGVSMGAVAVAKAISDYQLQPAAVVLDMPFASLQSFLKNKARTLGFPVQPFSYLTTFWIGLERGFNGYNLKSTRYTKQINCPVLLQWGGQDEFIFRAETEKIYNSIGSSQKKLVVYPWAGHESLLDKDPVKWRIEVGKLLGRS
jgi:alpha-beta hydrolase superfamily lysophospholipase